MDPPASGGSTTCVGVVVEGGIVMSEEDGALPEQAASIALARRSKRCRVIGGFSLRGKAGGRLSFEPT